MDMEDKEFDPDLMVIKVSLACDWMSRAQSQKQNKKVISFRRLEACIFAQVKFLL